MSLRNSPSLFHLCGLLQPVRIAPFRFCEPKLMLLGVLGVQERSAVWTAATVAPTNLSVFAMLPELKQH